MNKKKLKTLADDATAKKEAYLAASKNPEITPEDLEAAHAASVSAQEAYDTAKAEFDAAKKEKKGDINIVKTGHDGKCRIVTWSSDGNSHTVECKEINARKTVSSNKEAEKLFKEYCDNSQNQ